MVKITWGKNNLKSKKIIWCKKKVVRERIIKKVVKKVGVFKKLNKNWG